MHCNFELGFGKILFALFNLSRCYLKGFFQSLRSSNFALHFCGKKGFDDNRNLKYEFYIFSHQKDILFGHLSNKSRLQIMNIFISWGLTTIVYAIFLSFQLHTKASYATSSNIAVVMATFLGFSCIKIWRLIFYL